MQIQDNMETVYAMHALAYIYYDKFMCSFALLLRYCKIYSEPKFGLWNRAFIKN